MNSAAKGQKNPPTEQSGEEYLSNDTQDITSISEANSGGNGAAPAYNAGAQLPQAVQHGPQHPSGDEPNKTAPAPAQKTAALGIMQSCQRWLLWREELGNGGRPTKVPYYPNGSRRYGTLDTPSDMQQLGSYQECQRILEGGGYSGLAFALGPDGRSGHWQGIDLDDIPQNQLSDLANKAPGYVEVSPGRNGAHAIGYGRAFSPLGSNGTGVEAYSTGRFFTFTGETIRDSGLVCLADYVEQHAAPIHGAGRARTSPHAGTMHVEPRVVNDLRSALLYMRSDDRDLWIRMGHALRELGETGRGLWLYWSSTSEKHEPLKDSKTWNTLKPSQTGYQAVFAEAQKQGWVNPRSNAAQGYPGEKTPSLPLFNSRKPKDILRRASPPPFRFDEIPEVIAGMASSFSSSTGFDPSGAIVAATVAAAAAIDDRYQISVQPKTKWVESARLWAVLIGSPSAGKSPTIRAATDPIKSLHGKLFEEWNTRNEGVDEPEPMPALFTSDATIESLSEKLKGNPRGLLMLTEEFSSWVGGIDAYRDGAGARSRGEWLQLYDGGAHQIDRIKRGSFLVPNWSASVLAACTPDGLRDQMKKLPEDGLIHRFIPVIMESPNLPCEEVDARQALDEWSACLQWIYNMGGATIRFSQEADDLFKKERNSLVRLVTSTEEFSTSLASHLGKHGGMLARVALTFHVLNNPGDTSITAYTMQMAINFMRRVRQHSSAMFNDILGTSSAFSLARSIARSIAADSSRPASIGRNDMTQHCAAFKKSDDYLRRQAVGVLEDADWLEPQAGARPYGGWHTSQWNINPAVFDLFAIEGEKWRNRRAAVKELIGGEED